MRAQSRSYLHSIPKVSIFTHHNKLTSRIVSKLLMGLTTLNQALICTPTPNLMGVIWPESMISQAFQVSASKVRWPELSQLSLCSEFDKENSMEFSLISLPTYTLYYCGYALTLLWSSCYSSHVTHCDYDLWHDYLSHHCDIVTKSCDSFPCSTL